MEQWQIALAILAIVTAAATGISAWLKISITALVLDRVMNVFKEYVRRDMFGLEIQAVINKIDAQTLKIAQLDEKLEGMQSPQQLGKLNALILTLQGYERQLDARVKQENKDGS